MTRTDGLKEEGRNLLVLMHIEMRIHKIFFPVLVESLTRLDEERQEGLRGLSGRTDNSQLRKEIAGKGRRSRRKEEPLH